MDIVLNHPFIASLVISFLINTVFFLFAALFKTDKVTDISYSLSFLLLALALYFSGLPNQDGTRLLLTLAIVLWSVRLGGYLLYRIIVIGKDDRFDDKRDHFFEFLKFWVLQAFAVWLIMLPHSVYLSSGNAGASPVATVVGLSIFLVGLTIEAVSDHQKFRYKRNPDNKGKWMDKGLWKYSRHPNYFGEILLWWGLFAVAAPGLRGLQWLTVLGPVSITVLLLFVSGIPLLEKSAQEKYGGNSDYLQYRDTTNLLVPGPRRKPKPRPV